MPGFLRLYKKKFNIATGPGSITAGDPWWNQVGALFKANSKSTFQLDQFKDSSANNFSISKVGTPKTDFFSPYSHVGFSNYFNGSSDYLKLNGQTEFAFGTGDFTIEMWVYPTASIANKSLYDGRNGNGSYILVEADASSRIDINVNSAIRITGTTSLTTSTWYHVAVTRSGTATKLFVNGVQEGITWTDTTSYLTPLGPYIGSTGAGAYLFTGNISNLRVVKGTALYTSNFTVPTSQLTAVAGTSLLTCQANRFVDNSGNNFAVTVTGSPKVQAFSPLAPATYSAALHGGSIYFNGSSYLTVPSTPNLGFGTGDFTIECWINPLSIPSTGNYQFVLDMRVAGANSPSINLEAGYIKCGLTNNINVPANTNEWCHIAFVRQSGKVYVYKNGVIVNTGGTADTLDCTANGMANIGSRYTFDRIANFYLSGLAITKGVAKYTSNFTVPSTPIVSDSNTALLINGTPNTSVTGTNVSFIDNGALKKSITAFGGVTQGTKSPFPGQCGSAYFDGTGDYVLCDAATDCSFGTGDFTIECWINRTALGNDHTLIDFRPGTQGIFPALYIATGNVLVLHVNSGFRITTTTVLTVGTWYHVALTRSSGVTKLFINGVQEGASYADTNNYVFSGNRPAIGIASVDLNSSGFNGYVSNLNIIKGYAKYPSNFAVPTAPAVAHANTKLLLNFDNAALSDASGKHNYQLFGDVKTTTAVKKFNTSMSFDGTGDYILCDGSSDYAFGTGDFTIEMWVYPTVVGTLAAIYSSYPSGSFTTQANILLTAASKFAFQTGGVNQVIGATTASPNTWYHIAVSRTSGVTRLFVNGLQDGTGWNDTTNYNIPANRPAIGTDGYGLGTSNFSGYIEDLEITKGIGKYRTNFAVPGSVAPSSYTAPTDTDPYYNNVVLHMHMEGLNGSTQFVDQKGKTVTVSNATISNLQAKFGNTSGYFNGASNISFDGSSDFSFGSGAFTIECWINCSNTTKANFIYDTRAAGDASGVGDIAISIYNGKLGAFINDVYTVEIGSLCSVSSNQWYHIAFVRTAAGICTLYKDGVAAATCTTTASVGVGANRPIIGSYGTTPNDAQSFLGHIDEARVTKGIARYTSNFSVPTKAFPDFQDLSKDQYLANSLILRSQNAIVPQHKVFKDSSVFNRAITVVGDTYQSTFGPFANTGSAYFDGTGDYLTAPLAGVGDFGLQDFTIEFWHYHINTLYPVVIGLFSNYSTWGNGCIALGHAVGSGNKYHFDINNGTANTVVSTATVQANVWRHIAFVREGTTFKLFVDGQQVASLVLSLNITGSGTNTFFGAFGDIISTSTSNCYLSGINIIKGTAKYTSNFSVPTAPAVADANTKLLLNMGGAYDKTVKSYTNNQIIDSSVNNYPITRSGNVPQGTFSPFSNSGFSAYFDGTGDYLALDGSSDFAFGTGDFTIEMWVYWIGNSRILEFTGDAAYNLDINPTTGAISYYTRSTSRWSADGAIRKNTWNHIALVRSAGVNKIYVNGQSVVTQAETIDVTTLRPLYVGGVTSTLFNGYISNLNVIKGTAKYISNFTVPTSKLIADANTKLLTLNSGSLVDKSAAPHAITKYGDVSIQPFSPFAPATYSTASHGGSAYFDGSGDYLTLNGSSDFAFGTGDFTIEMWVYKQVDGTITGTTGQFFVDFRPSTGVGGYPTLISTPTNTIRYDTSSVSLISQTVMAKDTWYHVAVCRTSGVSKLFINGVAEASGADTSNCIVGAVRPMIGADGYQNAAQGIFKGYISNLNVIKGTAKYTTNFTPPTAPVVADTNTKLLLNFTNAALVDVTGKSVMETVGDAKLDVINKKYLGTAKFDGSGDYLTLNAGQQAVFGTGDWTIELWVYRNAIGANHVLYTTQPSGTNGRYPSISIVGSDNKVYYYTNSINAIISASTIPAYTWTHIAVSRVAGVTRMFINGVKEGSDYADTTDYICGANRPVIGIGDNLSSNPMNGLIEDLRITKGVGRYITNFTVPLKELPVV